MLQENNSAIAKALAQLPDPYLDGNLLMTGGLRSVDIRAGKLEVQLTLGYPADGIRGSLIADIERALQALHPDLQPRVQLSWEIPARPKAAGFEQFAGISNIVAVASAKGGVGKSTIAANLALALVLEGARVGILDADIYGPSLGTILGIGPDVRPDVRGSEQPSFVPIEAHGLVVMSMSFLTTERTPMVWRGPMVSGALQQLLRQTLWGELDYLLVDMPPGTGDIQLTLCQRAPLTGAIIVTTPQRIAVTDARKGIEMFRKVDVPVLGVIENMSHYVCPECGHGSHLFGAGGGASMAADYGVPMLGEIPLDASIGAHIERGSPSVVVEPDGDIAALYRDAARYAAAVLAAPAGVSAGPGPVIRIDED